MSPPVPRIRAIPTRIVIWENGVPRVQESQTLPQNAIAAAANAALLQPFDDPEGLYPEFEGMTCLEVSLINAAQRAAKGSLDHLQELLDRAFGKPKQSVETKKLTLTYQDFLDAQAKVEAARE